MREQRGTIEIAATRVRICEKMNTVNRDTTIRIRKRRLVATDAMRGCACTFCVKAVRRRQYANYSSVECLFSLRYFVCTLDIICAPYYSEVRPKYTTLHATRDRFMIKTHFHRRSIQLTKLFLVFEALLSLINYAKLSQDQTLAIFINCHIF